MQQPLVVAVGVKRVVERRRVRGPLGDRPAVVGAADKLVHLLETRAAHVVDEDAAGFGCTSNANALRNPRAKIAPWRPRVSAGNGLSPGMLPSFLIRRIFPAVEARLCDSEPSPHSPELA
jgi:hypothetical protein